MPEQEPQQEQAAQYEPAFRCQDIAVLVQSMRNDKVSDTDIVNRIMTDSLVQLGVMEQVAPQDNENE